MKKKFIKFLKEHKVYSEFRKITRINGRLILPNFDESVKPYARCGDILNFFNLRDSFGNYLWQLWELEYNKNHKPLYFKCHDGYYDSSIVNGVYLSPPSGKLFYNTFDFKTS